MTKKIYFDTETTGLNPAINDIIQIAGIIEIDNEIKEVFDFKIQPINWDNIEDSALAIHGITVDDLAKHEAPAEVYKKLLEMFGKYIDKFNKEDKFIVCGYNVRFDVDFLNAFFKKMGDNYLFSYFGTQKDPLPILNYLKSLNILNSENCKLETICKYFDIKLDNAHNAMADIEATKKVIDEIDKLLSGIKIKEPHKFL